MGLNDLVMSVLHLESLLKSKSWNWYLHRHVESCESSIMPYKYVYLFPMPNTHFCVVLYVTSGPVIS